MIFAIDRKGRIWFTDPAGQVPPEERELDHASVLRLDPDPDAEGGWTLRRMTFDTWAPNGILFSQDERTLYVVQSDYEGIRDLRAYPLQSDDSLGEPLVLHEFGRDFRGVHRGLDGMCLDVEGNIIAAWRLATGGAGAADSRVRSLGPHHRDPSGACRLAHQLRLRRSGTGHALCHHPRRSPVPG